MTWKDYLLSITDLFSIDRQASTLWAKYEKQEIFDEYIKTDVQSLFDNIRADNKSNPYRDMSESAELLII